MTTQHLTVFRPTMPRPPAGKPCRGCANAGPRDCYGTFDCRLLDDPANVDENEVDLAALVLSLWEDGETPEHCPGWQEHEIVVCPEHGPYIADDGCGACEAAWWEAQGHTES